MDKNLSRVMKKKEYKERSQPASRARLGLLEKKKDYVERAKDYHQKQDQLNRLKTKAFERNEDEFYFGMVNAETKDGVHHVEIGKKRSQSDLLRMKAEDLNYLNTIGQAEKQKIKKLKENLQALDAPAPKSRRHVVYKDTEDEIESFNAAEHFDTLPELLQEPAVKRLKLSQLESEDVVVSKMPAGTLAAVDKAKARAYNELLQRDTRSKVIEETRKKLDTHRKLRGKGKVIKEITRDEFGEEMKSKTVYKWKFERKR